MASYPVFKVLHNESQIEAFVWAYISYLINFEMIERIFDSEEPRNLLLLKLEESTVKLKGLL